MNFERPPSDCTILIAEDSPTQAERLRYTLERNGFRVESSSTGRQALQKTREVRPDLVISDIVMPEMDGYQLCRELKAQPDLRRVPVILVTTLVDPQDVIRGLESGADNFVVKPYEESDLLTRIQHALTHSNGNGSDVETGELEIQVNGDRHHIRADRRQVVNLLLSTYTAAVQRNQELTRTKNDLRLANSSLESANHELKTAIETERGLHHALKEAQSQLVQAEKLAGLGQMVAGVAHEINNPLSFVHNNNWLLRRDLASIRRLVELYITQDELIARHAPEVSAQLTEMKDQMNLQTTLESIEHSLASSLDGLTRIGNIVKDLRNFARLDRSEPQPTDLNEGIRSTVNIIAGRTRDKDVRIDLQLGRLPLILCQPAKINQVVMNLLSNAIDASKPGDGVKVSTQAADDDVIIEVVDTGTGIDPSIKARVFDPFFTTKEVGHGTGLGLSISYGIVREHQGTIEVESTPGAGSRFSVRFPSGAPQPTT